MLDLGWQELMLIAVIAIIVISPKDLPQAIRAITQFARQIRGLSREFRSGVHELVREAELDELRRQVEQARRLDHLDDVTSGVDPTKGLSADFEPRELAQERKRHINSEAPSTVDAPERSAKDNRKLPSGKADDRDGAAENVVRQENTLAGEVDKKTSV